MMVRHVATEACPPQPWRNGGGVTRELLLWPSRDDWVLRVSVATIDRSGPFSAFPGIDRWFTVIDGAGVRLSFPDGERTLTPADEPLAFPGEAAPDCLLVDGPTHDLNLMWRRDGLRARLARAVVDSALDGAWRWRGVYAADPALLAIDGVAEPLHAGTLAWSDETDASRWHLRDGGRAWWLTVEHL